MPSAPKRVSSTQGLSVRLHAPAYKTTMLHPFFFKQTAFPLSHDRNLGANKKKKKRNFTFTLLRLRNTCQKPTQASAPAGDAARPLLLPGRRRSLPGRPLARRKCGLPAAAVSGPAEGGSRGGGPGRDGGGGGRGGPGEAVPAGATQLLHLQPALRAARGRGTRSGAARGRQPAAEEGPGVRLGWTAGGVGPREPQGAPRRRPRPARCRDSTCHSALLKH